MQQEVIGNSEIIYPDQCETYVADYRGYVLSLLRQVIPSSSSVFLECLAGAANKHVFRIGINYEHVLVRPGGRDSDNSVSGIIRVIDDRSTCYLVRVVNLHYLSACDIVIDYSIPNIFNMQSSRKFPDLSKKHVYIAPCLYPIVWGQQERTIDLLTTFLNPDLPRRKHFSESCVNISDCFSADKICALYQKTKILINIHQTNDHHTVEELRILPALRNGVLVVCEDSPLRDMVPYHSMIIWASYDTILETAKKTLEVYEETWKRTFTDSNRRLLESLHTQNLKSLRDKFAVDMKSR